MSSSQSAPFADHCWLVSDDAARWLAAASTDNADPFALTKRLRKDLTAERTHLVVQQAELRHCARHKFARANEMFFTPTGLEQASDERIAEYKARRIAELDVDNRSLQIADLCCGIGGDMIALGQRSRVTGVDSSPIVALLAAANAERMCGEHCRVEQADVDTFSLDSMDAWHLDPDRRTTRNRTTRVEFSSPSLTVIEQMLASLPAACIKLAPAADVPHDWLSTCELEWVQTRGECRQQIVWNGALCKQPGQRTATVIQRETTHSFTADADERPTFSTTLRRYLYEPCAAVIAARLVGALANSLGCEQITSRVAYLTHDQSLDHPLLGRFEILDQLPFDLKRLKAYFRERRVGTIEVKKREVDCKPELLQKQLAARGTNRATLVLTPFGNRTIAIVARRSES